MVGGLNWLRIMSSDGLRCCFEACGSTQAQSGHVSCVSRANSADMNDPPLFCICVGGWQVFHFICNASKDIIRVGEPGEWTWYLCSGIKSHHSNAL
jgi:hypothetical protein